MRKPITWKPDTHDAEIAVFIDDGIYYQVVNPITKEVVHDRINTQIKATKLAAILAETDPAIKEAATHRWKELQPTYDEETDTMSWDIVDKSKFIIDKLISNQVDPAKVDPEWKDPIILKKDADHAEKGDLDHFNAVLEENQRRNKVRQWLIENVASASEDSTDSEGNPIKVLKKGHKFEHSFNKSTREMEITITPPLGAVAKNLIQNFVDNRLGAGKVKFI